MDIKDLNELRNYLIKNKKSVSALEYTKGNYDDSRNLIKEELPTITTDFCEIGLSNGEIYFVFIVESKNFNQDFFKKIKDKPSVRIYGFTNFNETLYPSQNFSFEGLKESVNRDKYLQIQFSYNELNLKELIKKYLGLVELFEKEKMQVVNQLEVDLH